MGARPQDVPRFDTSRTRGMHAVLLCLQAFKCLLFSPKQLDARSFKESTTFIHIAYRILSILQSGAFSLQHFGQ